MCYCLLTQVWTNCSITKGYAKKSPKALIEQIVKNANPYFLNVLHLKHIIQEPQSLNEQLAHVNTTMRTKLPTNESNGIYNCSSKKPKWKEPSNV